MNKINLAEVRMFKTTPAEFYFVRGKVDYNKSVDNTCVYDYIERQYKLSKQRLLEIL
jgi:hypothetical protein